MTLNTGKARAFNVRAFKDLSCRYGGYVADTTALAAIPAARRVDNMVILAGDDWYRFDDDAVSGSVAPAAGTGYWKIVTEGESVLTSLAAAGGALLVGITDAAANFDATTVEAALAEIMTIFASTANAKGASKVGVEDSGGLYAAAQVEAALAEVMTKTNAKVGSYHRLFDHADTDVAVAATTVSINFGAALPTNAIVAAVLANVTEAWDDDGPTDTWEGDVGVSGGDLDKYTPTALTLDAIADLGTQVTFLSGSATQLALTISASGAKLLNELVAGKLDLTVVYVTPEVTEVAAP